ncbi:MAG TPA: OmpA family protein [Geobacterales bacterium]|nr:OmpA family protein [Geobacterales bacterium]
MIAEEESADYSDENVNYFVPMTDMMVGVLFIFILMLTAFALDFRRTTDAQETALKVAQEVANKLDPLQSAVREQMALLDKAQQDRRELLQDIRTQLAGEGLSVQIDEANGVLRLNEDAVRFAPNHADLVDRNKDNVGKIARVLERVLPKYVSCHNWQSSVCSTAGDTALETLFIEGHTDTTGIDNSNWVLSTERAVNTYRELIAVSPALRLLRNNRNEEVISVSGYSSTRPIDPRALRDAWDRNRRIDLRFVMDNDPRRNLEHILHVTDEMHQQINRLRAASEAAR